MFALLRLDLNRMLAANLPAGRGLDLNTLHDLARGPGQPILQKLRAMVESEEGTFANTFRRPEITRAMELADSCAGRYRNFVLVGIDRSTRTIVRWEKQRNMPSLSGIEAISKALNVPISFFLNGENTYEPDTVSNGIKI